MFRSSRENVKKLQLKTLFLTYLDEEGILKDLEMATVEYQKYVRTSLKHGNFIPPFRFLFELDIVRIQEVSEKLLYVFMKEPESGITLTNNVFFCAVNLLMPSLQLTRSDLQIVPRIVNLPITSEILDLLHCPSYGIECIEGVLIGKTTIARYVRSSVLRCEVKFCPRFEWQRYPKNFEYVCPECFGLMEEDISSTDTGEEIICHFVSLKAYQSMGRFQALTVRIKDELCYSVDLLVGEIFRLSGRLNDNYFEVMNIQEKQLRSEFFMELSPHLNSYTIPKSISDLYFRVSEFCPNCPWSFVVTLSSVLASHLIPTSSFLHLKTGLMLSLSSQKNYDAPVPLVAVGPDSLNAHNLFSNAGKLAERYVRHSVSHSCMGGTVRPGFQPQVVWEEPGQLILAAKGVCDLGDWSKFKKEQANYICQTIESGQIVLNKDESGKPNLINFAPLKCSVWTYWCHITTSRNHQLQLKTLINVFGIPFLADERNELEMNKTCRKNLEGALIDFENTPDNDSVSPEDLKQFLEIINSRDLTLSDRASHLIRSYFVVSRRERPQCLPLGAIKTITSLAEAHARLALRDEVLYEDVVAVIYLYEEAISTLFGESMNPWPKLVWKDDEPIYVHMSKQMEVFQNWLERYISD